MYWNKEKKSLDTGAASPIVTNLERWAEPLTASVDAWRQRMLRYGRKKLLWSVAALTASGWLVSGIYIVNEGNQAVVTRFGAYRTTEAPGPHWHWPYPIEHVTLVNTARQRFIEIGYRSGEQRQAKDVLGEALMLTRDENIIDVKLAVQYQVHNAADFLFNVEEPEATLKQAAQSAQRAVIGKNDMDFVLTSGRGAVAAQIQQTMQALLDQYGTGIQVTSVNLQDAQPPEQVQTAFQDAIKAREDKQRLINEAEAYYNEVLPKARGETARLMQEAEAYKQQVIAMAEGEISRFNQVFAEYQKAPEVTRKRLMIDAMEAVFKASDVVMLDGASGQAPVIYLPVDKFRAHPETAPAATTGQTVPAAEPPRPSFQRSARGRG